MNFVLLPGLDGTGLLMGRLVPARALTPFQEALPDLSIEKVEGPHFLLQARPDHCVGLILRFAKPLV